MNVGMISSRYATAMLGFATQQKLENEFYEMAKLVCVHFDEQPKLMQVLESPVVDLATKKQLLLLAAGSKKNASFDKFVQMVIDNKREKYFRTIMLKYIDFYRDRLNIYSGKLITATAIDAKLEKKLISVIENRKEGTLELRKEVNPDLIGGFILEVDNTRWDASIKRQLQAIKNELNF